MNGGLPQHARVVVVGGGIIGNSVAYHLGKLGWRDVVLLERDKLTSGTTWHAAGLMVTFGSINETSTEMRKYTKNLYKSIEEETGLSSGFKPIGFIELATNKDYLYEFRKVAASNRMRGIDVQEIGPSEIKKLFPLCNVDDVISGFYVPDDGRVNPVDAAMALSKGAKMHGVKYFEETPVIGIEKGHRKITAVHTARGTIKADYVVNCAGMWARQFGEMAGVKIPNQAAEHYYLVTDPMPEVSQSWPVVEDPSSYTYIRPETNGGLMIGLFEPEAAAWNVKSIPQNFSFGEIQPDFDRMSPFLEKAMARVPASLSVGMRSFFCGPESFTPDLSPIVGKAQNYDNYFIAAGLNSIGILTGGGIGRNVAQWIVDGKPDVDVSAMDCLRVESYQCNHDYRRDRVVESLGMVYKNHFPNYHMKTARNVKRSPIYEQLKARNAYFRPVSGWESADWYADTPSPKIEELKWTRENWFGFWKREHDACRERAALIDMSFMTKILVQGPDAGALLEYLSTAAVSTEKNTITYTQWLDEEGKVRADLTVAKTDCDEKYWVIATDNMRNTVLDWLERHGRGKNVQVFDATGMYAQINLQGPLSREILQKITTTDMSNEGFPFRRFQEIEIGYARAYCSRMTYVGELGYELFIPAEMAVHVYEQIVSAGEPLGLAHVGLKALSSLRMEKGYRDFGHDIDNTDELVSVGLTFTCDADKDYQGRDAVLKQKDRNGHLRRLVQVLVQDPEPLLFHGEVIRRDGKILGDVRSASYGHTLGGAVGLAMIEADESITPKYLKEGKWEIEIAGKIYPIRCSLAPLFDPKNLKIKC